MIADYPKSTFSVGENYPAEEIRSQSFYNQYPHLFRKLEWWEERKPEEMPTHVRYEPTFFVDEKRGTIHKIKVWGKWGDEDKILTGQIYGIVETPNFPNEFSKQTNIAHFQPATLEEYNQQHSSPAKETK